MSGQGPRDTTTSSLWVAVSSVDLPDKKYFKIGEVAQLVGVEPHVLRYWQTQFPQVRPQKSRSGHRLYRRRDVETLLAIRELLHVQRFTIAGARQALRGLGKNPSTLPEPASETASAPVAAPRGASGPVDAFRALSEQRRVHDLETPGDVPTGEVEVSVEALEEEELAIALSRQLAEARGAAVEAVEIGAEEIGAEEIVEAAREEVPARVRVENAVVHARVPASAGVLVGAPAASTGVLVGAPAASRGASVSSGRPAVPGGPASPGMSVSAGPLVSRSSTTHTVVAPPAPPVKTSVPPPAAEGRRARRRGEQLGFGFLPSSKTVLEAARVEILAILDALERDEAESRRRLSGAPTSRAFES